MSAGAGMPSVLRCGHCGETEHLFDDLLEHVIECSPIEDDR